MWNAMRTAMDNGDAAFLTLAGDYMRPNGVQVT